MEENIALNFILYYYIFVLDRDSQEQIEKEKGMFIMWFFRDSTCSQKDNGE